MNSLQPMQKINSINGKKKKAPKHSVTVFSHKDGLFEVRTPINPNSTYRGNHRHEVNALVVVENGRFIRFRAHMSLSCVNIKASLQCDILTVATIWKNKLLVMHLDFTWFQTVYIGMSLISRSCILISSYTVKKVDQEQLGFKMKWTKAKSINQGHCAVFVGKKAIIEEHASLKL